MCIVFSLVCSREIPVMGKKNATRENKEKWEKFYDSVPELKYLSPNVRYEIRVKRIIDSRFDNFSEEKYQALYKQISDDIGYYLGYNVSLKDVGSEDIIHFFRKQRKVFKQPWFQYMIGQHFLHLDRDEDRRRLHKTIEKAVTDTPWEILKLYITDKEIKNKDIPAITEYFYSRFLTKYSAIGNIKGNVKYILRQGEYELTQHYTYWSAALYATSEADLFITNSIIAGADDQMPLYVINRGGITSGITENNLHNKFQGAIVLTLMPFISGDSYFNSARGNIYDSLLLPVISMMAVHEFGHLLHRYDEYYDLPATPQNAPVDLKYQDWYQHIIDGKMYSGPIRTLKKY